jgi:hypothetical protein
VWSFALTLLLLQLLLHFTEVHVIFPTPPAPRSEALCRACIIPTYLSAHGAQHKLQTLKDPVKGPPKQTRPPTHPPTHPQGTTNIRRC